MKEWFDAPYDVVIAVEFAYAVGVQDLLVQTMAAASGPATRVILGHEHRWRDVDEWLREEVDKKFTSVTIPPSQHPPQFRYQTISIFALTLKPSHAPQPGDEDITEDSHAQCSDDDEGGACESEVMVQRPLGPRDPFTIPRMHRKVQALAI